MKISKEQEEQIINCGVFDYSPEKIANILGMDTKTLTEELKNKDSTLNQLLQKGRDMSDYVIDLKLFDLAKSGDIKALEKLDHRKAIRLREKR